MGNKLVFGIGVNDSDYKTVNVIEGKQKMCRIFSTWRCMLCRCYSKKRAIQQPTYDECSVCDEWLTFSNFKAWMDTQDWHEKALDKDILKPGNKIYSPEFCVFVSQSLNNFVLTITKKDNGLKSGLHLEKQTGRFKAQCHNPFTGKHENLGRYKTQDDAHSAWKIRKHQLACQYAEMQTDERIARALSVRYEK